MSGIYNKIVNSTELAAKLKSLTERCAVDFGLGFVVEPGGDGRQVGLDFSIIGTSVQEIDQPLRGIHELYPVYSAARLYRLGERVVFKPDASDYYLIYECTVADTINELPDQSMKWDCKTVLEDDWDDNTSYSVNDKCMAGSPYDISVYQSLAANNEGNYPPDSEDKWERKNYVVFGLPTWPPTPHKCAFAEFVVNDVRYSTITYDFTISHTRHIFNAGGKLIGVEPSDYVIIAKAEPC